MKNIVQQTQGKYIGNRIWTKHRETHRGKNIGKQHRENNVGQPIGKNAQANEIGKQHRKDTQEKNIGKHLGKQHIQLGNKHMKTAYKQIQENA